MDRARHTSSSSDREANSASQGNMAGLARIEPFLDHTSELFCRLSTDGTLTWVNRAVHEMLGYNPRSLVGQNFAVLLFPSDHRLIFDFDHRIPLADLPERTTHRARCADGRTKWFETRFFRPAVPAATGELLSISRDVTMQKAVEENIRASKLQAELLNSQKSALIDAFNHEFRTPLTSIIGYSDILAEELDRHQKEFADDIAVEARKLFRSLATVGHYSQIEEARFLIQLRPDRLGDFIDHAVNQAVRARQLCPGVDLAVDISECADELVFTDRDYAIELLAQVLDNAIKFTSRGTILVTAQCGDTSATICVRDSGVGMHPEFLSRAYEPFAQESRGLTREFDGIGLGLTLVDAYAEMLDHEIRIESRPDIGTTVSVRIPLIARAGG